MHQHQHAHDLVRTDGATMQGERRERPTIHHLQQHDRKSRFQSQPEKHQTPPDRKEHLPWLHRVDYRIRSHPPRKPRKHSGVDPQRSISNRRGRRNRNKLPMMIVFLLQIACSVALIILGATGNHDLILIGALLLILTILSRWESKRTSRRENERPHHRKD